MNKVVVFLVFLLFCSGGVFASSVSVWQGQYYTGTTFNTGTYVFNFTVYDAETGGSVCFTNTTSLTTGNWGQWRSEQSPWALCNNASKDYFLNINIDGVDQTPRRRLTVSDFLRRDVSGVQEGNLIVGDNITADYYFGDGRYLVGVNGSGDINSVQGDEVYLYNGSDSGNVVLAFNESRLNSTIDDRASGLGDNSSWNESYADGKYLNLSGGNADQDINISPYNFEAVNLTLGQKITFGLGEIIDNVVDGWIKITGGLNVSGDVIVGEGLNVTNDSYFFEDVYVAGKVRGLSPVEIAGGLNVSGNTTFNNDINLSGIIYGNGSQLTDIEADSVSDSSVVTSSIADNNITDSKIANVSWDKLVSVPSGLSDGDNDTTYSHLSNFTDDILWTSSFNSTGDSRWSGGVDTQKNASGYLYNDTTTIYLNDTKLNSTIDARENDTLGDVGACGNEQVVKWNATSSAWYCSDVAAAGAGDIDAVNTDGPYLTGGQTSGSVSLLLNETKLNATISGEGLRLGFNSTFNSTYDTKADYQFLGNNFNGSGNITASYFVGNGSGLTSVSSQFFERDVGDYSIIPKNWSAFALGNRSISLGYLSSSGGDFSFSIGRANSASGNYSFSGGRLSTASGEYSSALGYLSTASGQAANSFGYFALAQGDSSFAVGNFAKAYGNYSVSIGDSTNASGDYSFALGDSIKTVGQNSFGIGLNSTLYNITSSNIFSIMGGKVGIGTVAPNDVLTVSGNATISGNLTAGEIHLEQDSVNHRIYDNSSCVIIRGDTSTMYIC